MQGLRLRSLCEGLGGAIWAPFPQHLTQHCPPLPIITTTWAPTTPLQHSLGYPPPPPSLLPYFAPKPRWCQGGQVWWEQGGFFWLVPVL